MEIHDSLASLLRKRSCSHVALAASANCSNAFHFITHLSEANPSSRVMRRGCFRNRARGRPEAAGGNRKPRARRKSMRANHLRFFPENAKESIVGVVFPEVGEGTGGLPLTRAKAIA